MRVRIQAGEGGAVVARSRGVRVENLAKAMGSMVSEATKPLLRHKNCHGGKAKDEKRKDEQIQHGHLHVVGFDSFAQVLRRAPDHEAGRR